MPHYRSGQRLKFDYILYRENRLLKGVAKRYPLTCATLSQWPAAQV
nr:MAG TPA: hypothetical protein [Caudoviricetes sp.]